MKMRVLTTVAVAAVLAAGLSACQRKAGEANTGNTAAVETTNTAPATEMGNAAPAEGNAMAGNAAPAEGNAMAGNAAGNAATGNAAQ